MQAVVLVGGEGTRLRPLTLETPKPMVPIMNVPFLEWTLRRLKDAGIDDIILPAGYLPEAITNYFGDGKSLGLKIRYVIEETPLGTAGAIKNVAQYITGSFFVLNGDVLTSLDLRAMMDFHKEKAGMGVIHLIKVDDPSAFGCVVHDEDGKVVKFVEKPKREEAPSNEINAGTYLLDPAILDLIPEGRAVSIERETFPAVIRGQKPLYAYTTDDYWLDLGNPEAYLTAHRDIFLDDMPMGIGDGAEGPGAKGVPAGALEHPVYIGRDVVVAPDARIGPFTVLGDGCSVGAGAVVSGSLLWDAVVVGAGATIEDAIVASRVHIGSGARVQRGAVIGHDSQIAPDTVVDENARIAAR